MLAIIAWRNIWRSRTRSLVVIGAIVLGIWALVFMISFSVGMVRSYVNNAIENTISHLQVHEAAFRDNQELEYYYRPDSAAMQKLAADERVAGLTHRSLVNAMVGSSRGTRGIQVRGIDPETEARVTKLDAKVTEGEYFGEAGRNPILLGHNLADKLGVRPRSKVVLTFQDLEGNITAGAFRIAGLFDTGNNMLNEGVAFVKREDLNRLLGAEGIAHETALFLHGIEQVDSVQALAQSLLPDLKVETYRQISPDVQLYEGQIQTSATIFMVIIMLALLFGIVNTMLMAVLERYRELGMLMAIGMNKLRVFSMIVLETLLLAAVALLPGLLLGWGTVRILSERGIDLSAFASGMKEFGMSQVVYPELQTEIYIQLAVAVGITAIVGALYPAWKAIRLRPVEAIQKI